MSYEILLSDTARADMERNPPAAIPALLERIAQSPELDHALSAPESKFELRYQSLGRSYVFFRRDESARQVSVIYFCEMNVPPAALPMPEPHLRVLDRQVRDIPNGMEVEAVLEVTQPDGSSSIRHHYVRKVDLGEHYMTIVNQPPGGTLIVTGKKGRIEGDFRHDEIELVHLQAEGSIKRFPPNVVPVLIRNPFEGDGRELNERMRDYMNSPMFEQRMQIARKWLALG